MRGFMGRARPIRSEMPWGGSGQFEATMASTSPGMLTGRVLPALALVLGILAATTGPSAAQGVVRSVGPIRKLRAGARAID